MTTPTLKHLTTCTLIAMGIITTPVIAEPKVEISGVVEVEISSGKDHANTTKGSDIALATVEIGIDAQINDKVSAHILMLHEDGEPQSNIIDEGIIAIKGKSMFLNAGRFYIPFGNFESNMVSDPLTLELGETQEAAVEVGIETGGLRASIYAFNGGADQVTTATPVDNDVVDDFGISIGYSMKTGSMNMDFGFDYINNMAETDGLEGALLIPSEVQEHTSGMALHAIINVGAFTFIAEHVTASDDFNTTDLQFNGAKASPSASNIEIAYTMGDITVAVAQQSTADLDPAPGALLPLPETRNMLSVSTTVSGDAALAVEFSNASDYEIADGGTGESGSTVTAQLAVEF